MALGDFIQVDPIQPPRRIRKTHAKVKTGCKACKINRKKCDELPICSRCVRAGWCCEYEQRILQPHKVGLISDKQSTPIRTTPNKDSVAVRSTSKYFQLCRPPGLGLFASDEEFQCFEFFRMRTSREFTGYFDSSIWRVFIIKASFLHPTVLQAAAAVGAAHRRYELGISVEAFRYCDIATKQYRKTLKHLNDDLCSRGSIAPELISLVSLLLAIFHAFQGDYADAISQYCLGLTQLFRRKLKRTHIRTQYRNPSISFEALRNFTDELESSITRLLGTYALSASGYSVAKAMPERFDNVEQARDLLVAEGRHIWEALLVLQTGNTTSFAAQQYHVSRLLHWSKAYAEFSKASPPHVADRGRYLLKVYREALYLVILAQVALHEPDGHTIFPSCTQPQWCFNHHACESINARVTALNAHFARLLIFGEAWSEGESVFTYTNEYSISVDTGIKPALQLDSNHCRSSKVRYQAAALPTGDLQRTIWDKLGVYNIAEKLGSIEEHALAKAVAECMPELQDSKWLDVTCFLDDRKMLLSYCKDDGPRGMLWTQEWVTYC